MPGTTYPGGTYLGREPMSIFYKLSATDTGVGAEVVTQSLVNVGNTAIGTVDDTPNVDAKSVSITTVTTPGFINNAYGYLSGLGPGVGANQYRVVVYSDNAGNPDVLLAQSDEVVIADGSAYSWRTFSFSKGYYLPAGNIHIGYLVGGVQDGAQMKGIAGSGLIFQNPGLDTYADGASNPFGTISGGSGSKSGFSVYLELDIQTRLMAVMSDNQTGSGSDLGDLGIIAKSGSDTISSSDASSELAALSGTTESATTAEASVEHAALSGTETPATTEASAEVYRPSASDSGAGADDSVKSVLQTGSDSGAGSDSASSARLVSDAGSGVDASTEHAALSLSEAASSIEATLLAAALSLTQQASGVDNGILVVALLVLDSLSGVDVGVVTISVFDSGSGTDNGTVPLAKFTLSENLLASDSATLSALAAVFEDMTAAESVLLAAALLASDVVDGVDSGLLLRMFRVADTGEFFSQIALHAYVQAEEVHVGLLEITHIWHVSIEEIASIELSNASAMIELLDVGVFSSDTVQSASIIATEPMQALLDASLRARESASDNAVGSDVGTQHTYFQGSDSGQLADAFSALEVALDLGDEGIIEDAVQLLLDSLPPGEHLIVAATPDGGTLIGVGTPADRELTATLDAPRLLSAEDTAKMISASMPAPDLSGGEIDG